MDTLKNDEIIQQGTETLKNNKQVKNRNNSRNKKLDEIKKISIKSENKLANNNTFEEVEDLDGKKSDEVNFFRDSETKINPFDFSKINVPHFENDEASSQQYYASGTKNQIHIVLRKDQNKDQKEMLRLQQSLQKNAKRSKTQQNDQNIQILQTIAKQNPNLKIDFNQNINSLLNELISNNKDMIQKNGNLNINGIIIKGAPSLGTKFNPNFRDSHHSSKPQSRGLTQGNVLQIATQALAIIQNLETQVKKKKKKKNVKQKEIINKNMHDSLEDYQNSQGLGFNITIKSRRTPDQNSLMMQGYKKQASLKIKSQETQKQNFSDYNNFALQNQQYQKQRDGNQEKKMIKIQGGGQDGQDKITFNINLKQNNDNNIKIYQQFSHSPKRMLRKNSYNKNAAVDSLGHLSLDQKQNQENDFQNDKNKEYQKKVEKKEKSSTTQRSIELNIKTLKIKSLSQQIQEGDNFRNKSSDVHFNQNQDYLQEDKNYEQKYKRHKDGSVANIESKEYYANNRKIRSRIPSASDDKLSEFQFQNKKIEQFDDKNTKLQLKQRLTNMKKTNKKQIYTSTIQPQIMAQRDDSFKLVRRGQPIKDFLKKIAHLEYNDKKFKSVNSMSPFRLENGVLSGSVLKAGSLDQDSLEEDLRVKSISNANTLNINLVGPHHQIHQLIMKSKITKKHILRKPQVTNKATTMIQKNNSKSTVQDVESRLKNISREILSNKNTNLLINSKGSENKIKTEMIENTMSGQYHSNRDHIFKEAQISNQIKQLQSFQHSQHDNFKSDRISKRLQDDEHIQKNQNLREQEELNLSSQSQKIKNLSGKISARKVNTKRVTVASNQNKSKTNEKLLVKVLSEGDSIDNQNLKSSFGITQTSNKINEDLIQLAINNKEENVLQKQQIETIQNENAQKTEVEQNKQNDINCYTQNKLKHFNDELEPNNNIKVIQLASQINEQNELNQFQSENFNIIQINMKQGTSNEYTKAHPSERRDPNQQVLLNENEKLEIFKRLKTLIPKKSKKVIMNKNVFVDIDEINYSEISSNANLLDQSEILQMQINDTQKTVVNNSSDYNNIRKQKENQKIMNNNNMIDETNLIPFENMQVKKMNKKHMNKIIENFPQNSEITKIVGNESNSRLNTIHSKNQIHEIATQQQNESITVSAKIKQASFAKYHNEDQIQNQQIFYQESQTFKYKTDQNQYLDQNSQKENNSLLLSDSQKNDEQNKKDKPYLQKNQKQESFQLKINQQNLIYSYSSSEQQKLNQIKKADRVCLETSESLKIDEFIDQIKANNEKQNKSMNKLQSQENENESKVPSRRTISIHNEIAVEQFNPIQQVCVKRRHSNDFTDVVSKNSYKILSIYPTVNDRNSQPDIDQIQMQSKVIRANQFTSKSNQFQIHGSMNADIINRQNESDFKQSKI